MLQRTEVRQAALWTKYLLRTPRRIYRADVATAVVRVMVDADGRLAPADYVAGVELLGDLGFNVIASPPEKLPERRREIELIIDEDGAELRTEGHLAACSRAFGTTAKLGVVTYISRGTDEDARGVLQRFRVQGEVRRELIDDEEIVTVTIRRADLRRVPESRLHTALESALNCEVRIAVVPEAR